ncbi:MAG TPA: hypothetical protein VGC82_18145, partial [Rhodopila sp.]
AAAHQLSVTCLYTISTAFDRVETEASDREDLALPLSLSIPTSILQVVPRMVRPSSRQAKLPGQLAHLP